MTPFESVDAHMFGDSIAADAKRSLTYRYILVIFLCRYRRISFPMFVATALAFSPARASARILAAQAQSERDAGRDPRAERAVVDFDELKKAFDVIAEGDARSVAVPRNTWFTQRKALRLPQLRPGCAHRRGDVCAKF